MIINDGYVSSQPYKCLWIRGFCGLKIKRLLCGLDMGNLQFANANSSYFFDFRYWINLWVLETRNFLTIEIFLNCIQEYILRNNLGEGVFS